MHHKINNFQLKSGSKTLDLSTPKVMGILNITDDSFYDGGKFNSINKSIDQVSKMLDEGASIIDIGAASSNPKSVAISKEEEWEKLSGFFKIINKEFPNTWFSVDTYHSEVAKKAHHYGVDIINDISGGELDQNMFKTIEELKSPYIMMHMKGTPQSMQSLTSYNDLVSDVFEYFKLKIEKLLSMNINQLVIDLGFGFSKTLEQNYKLLNNMDQFKELGLPILAGISRKSMVYKPLQVEAKDALNGTTFLHHLCLSNGSSILRSHDVKEAVECIKLFNLAQNNL
jgi:dihydropteroate synthase